MEAAQRKQLFERAVMLEKQGKQEAAVQSFVQAGAHEQAARVLVALNRYLDAGRVLLQSIGYDRHKTANLDPDQRKTALKAAICLGRGGETKQAVEMFLVLGERARAAELLKSTGDHANAAKVEGHKSGKLELAGYETVAPEQIADKGPDEADDNDFAVLRAARQLEAAGKIEAAMESYVGIKRDADAGRMAVKLNRLDQAASFFAQAGLHFEAASCLLKLGQVRQALKHFVLVPRDHERYRESCVHAITAAAAMDDIDFQLEHLLGKFVTSGPVAETEMKAFYVLADLFARHNLEEDARECYRKLLAKNPNYEDAQDRLRELSGKGRQAQEEIEKIYKDEQAARAPRRPTVPVALTEDGEEEPPDLPDLPDLPQLRPAPPMPAAPAGGGGGGAGGGGGGGGGGQHRPSGGVPIAPMPGGGSGQQRPSSGRPVSNPTRTPEAPEVALPSHMSFHRDGVGAGAKGGGAGGAVGGGAGGGAAGGAGGAGGGAGAATGPLSMNRAVAGKPGQNLTSPAYAEAGLLTDGAIVNERYRIEKKIGQGGMGAVYKAVDLELEETIAIKFFSAAVADEALLIRFKQEVTLSRQFNHPNIIRLYDLGTYGQFKYITMEFLAGSDLAAVLTGKPMDFDTALNYLIQASSALHTVHDRGVIHRDIKPENFFVTKEDQLKVVDFGIAKRHSATRSLTRAGMMAGTPQYMAPEQINDFGGVTHLADLYSLGCIAYQMFTGAVPFNHEELMPILVGHMTQPVPPPCSKNPQIPLDLETVILRLLEKQPANRIQSCKELEKSLTQIRARLKNSKSQPL